MGFAPGNASRFQIADPLPEFDRQRQAPLFNHARQAFNWRRCGASEIRNGSGAITVKRKKIRRPATPRHGASVQQSAADILRSVHRRGRKLFYRDT